MKGGTWPIACLTQRSLNMSVPTSFGRCSPTAPSLTKRQSMEPTCTRKLVLLRPGPVLSFPNVNLLIDRLPQVWNGFVLGSVQPSARIPHAIYVASPSESRVVIAANLKCVVCNASFLAHRNSPGHCSHSEPWHSDFASCSKGTVSLPLPFSLPIHTPLVRCAFGLGVGKIGRQHWGCCFDTDRTALVCPHSSPHRHEIKGKLPEYFK